MYYLQQQFKTQTMKYSKFKILVLAIGMTIGFIGIILLAGPEPKIPKGKIPTYGNIYQPTQDHLV